MHRVSLFLLSFTIIFFLACANRKKSHEFHSKVIDSNQGVSIDTLDLIYDGPKGFTLAYFPREIIHSAHITGCEIVDRDSSSETITRKILFDRNGNIITDDNSYFQYWFKGTVRGRYKYYYNSSNNLIKMIGIPTEDSKDSTMTINNYNQNGLLYSRDRYEFAKKLKPEADKHLPQPSDFEKYPTWNKLESYKFSHESNTIVVETVFEGKIIEKEKYVLEFDSLGRLSSTTKYTDTLFDEVTYYIYESKSITGNLRRKMNDGKEWRYNSKSIIGDNKYQTEKILFKDDGTDKVRMITTYNSDGTIGSINYDNSIQIFKYSYY